MLYFIACHAPDFHGAKVADGLARVTLPKTTPHMAFASRELAQYYLDCRNANKLCYIVSEESLSDILWYDFSDGVLIFRSIRDIRKSLKDINHILNLQHSAYSPQFEYAS